MTPVALPARSLYLDDARPGGRTIVFTEPLDWIELRDPADLAGALARIDAAVAAGFWVAGSFAFELGYLLEPRLAPAFRPGPDPLIAAGVYRAPRAAALPASGGAVALGAAKPAWSEAA